MKKLTVFLFALLVIGGLAVTGSKVIHAQPGFSNASLSGTYVFHFAGNGSSSISLPVPVASPPAPQPVEAATFPITTPQGGVGEIQADGAGNITAGSGTFFSQHVMETVDGSGFPTFTVVDNSCDITVAGTYSINADGSGTMTLTPSGSCISPGGTITFNLRIAARGSIGVFASSTPNSGGGFATIVTGGFAKK